MAPTEVGYVRQLADIGDEVVRVFDQRSVEIDRVALVWVQPAGERNQQQAKGIECQTHGASVASRPARPAFCRGGSRTAPTNSAVGGTPNETS
jgi:hypothetical protein